MAGAELCRDGPCRVLLSSMHAHAAPAPAAPSGLRHGRAPRGAGRQPCRRALLCPEAVVVLWGKARERNRGTVGIADAARARVHGHTVTQPRSWPTVGQYNNEIRTRPGSTLSCDILLATSRATAGEPLAAPDPTLSVLGRIHPPSLKFSINTNMTTLTLRVKQLVRKVLLCRPHLHKLVPPESTFLVWQGA